MSSDPILSVCVITYNHAAFLRQALDGVLMQDVDFPHEIIIADDASTDGTREIVEQYARDFPGRVRALVRERNVGPAVNFRGLIKAARGKYVAHLEGDDYWIDRRKLQTQVSFLEANPDFALAFHNALEVDEGGRFADHLFCSAAQKETTTLVELLGGNFIPSCSVMYRRGLFGEFPRWYMELLESLKMGDWTLHILNAHYGKIRYFNRVWGVHRHHAGGVWTSKRHVTNLEHTIKILETLRDNLDPKYSRIIVEKIAEQHLDLATVFAGEGQVEKTLASLYRAHAVLLRAVGHPVLSRKAIATTLRAPASLFVGLRRR